MAEVEPIKLDMGGLMQMGLGLQQNQIMQQRLGLEQEQTRLQEQRLAVDAMKASDETELKYMTEALKDPNIPITMKYTMVNKIGAKAGIGKIDPAEYVKAENLFNGFVTSAARYGPTPETQSMLAELMQSPVAPLFRAHAAEQLKQAQEQAKVKGGQQFGSRAFNTNLTPEEGRLVSESPQLQGKAGEIMQPLEQAKAKEVANRTANLQLEEQQLTNAQKNLLSYTNPIFDMNAEQSYVGMLFPDKKLGKVSSALIGTPVYDSKAQESGTLTAAERRGMKTQVTGDIQQLGEKRKALQAELRQARYSSGGEGDSRDVETIQSELQGVQMGMQVKQAEQAYLAHPSAETFQNLQQVYGQLDTVLSTNKEKIGELRTRQLGTAQGALNEKIYEYQQKQAYDKKLMKAQSEFTKTDMTNKTAGIIAEKHGVLTTDLLDAAKNPNKPLVEMNVGKGLAEQVGPIITESRNAAMGANDTIDAVGRARAAISKDLVNVGPTATIRQKIGQVSQVLGIGGKDTEEQLVNTRNVIRSLAQFSLGARKQLKGQGQVSDFEGKLIVKAESGEIEDMTIPELKSFLDVTERLARKSYANHQHNLETMKAHPELKDVVPFFEVPALPESKPSAPQSGWSIRPLEK